MNAKQPETQPGSASPPGEPSAFRRFLEEEEASAAVEFVVLIPVYLLLLAGLFVIGNLAMVRQSLVSAVRFQAWSATDPHEFRNFQPPAGKAFFGPYAGTFEAEERKEGVNLFEVSVWGPAEGRVVDGDMQAKTAREASLFPTPREAQARKIARVAFNNGNDRPFWLVRARGRFTYTGIQGWVGLSPTSQTTKAAVLLPRLHIRSEYTGTGHPFVNLFRGDYFDPSQRRNRPISPLFSPGGFKKGGSNDGIWANEARINGSQTAEWSYYVHPARMKPGVKDTH